MPKVVFFDVREYFVGYFNGTDNLDFLRSRIPHAAAAHP
jgi:hypothetical protein